MGGERRDTDPAPRARDLRWLGAVAAVSDRCCRVVVIDSEAKGGGDGWVWELSAATAAGRGEWGIVVGSGAVGGGIYFADLMVGLRSFSWACGAQIQKTHANVVFLIRQFNQRQGIHQKKTLIKIQEEVLSLGPAE